ncbi:hypothetical protein ACFLX1_02005, partial [Chloroflexota bacterium]
ALGAILWKELPLAQDMAAGVPSIRANLMGNNTASLFGETSRGGDVSKNRYPEGRSVGRQEGIIWHMVWCGPICRIFGSRLTRVADRCLIYRGKDA